MGYHRVHYTKRKHNKLQEVKIDFRNEKDIFFGHYVFREHFFYNYRNRVERDVLRLQRSDQDIVQIAVHSFLDSDIPKKLGIETKVLVDFHSHELEMPESFGLFYVPMRRDKFNLKSGKICPITILCADEKLSFLQDCGRI